MYSALVEDDKSDSGSKGTISFKEVEEHSGELENTDNEIKPDVDDETEDDDEEAKDVYVHPSVLHERMSN